MIYVTLIIIIDTMTNQSKHWRLSPSFSTYTNTPGWICHEKRFPFFFLIIKPTKLEQPVVHNSAYTMNIKLPINQPKWFHVTQSLVQISQWKCAGLLSKLTAITYTKGSNNNNNNKKASKLKTKTFVHSNHDAWHKSFKTHRFNSVHIYLEERERIKMEIFFTKQL